MIDTSITAAALEKISLGSEVSLFGKVAFRHGTTLREEPINMVTVADTLRERRTLLRSVGLARTMREDRVSLLA